MQELLYVLGAVLVVGIVVTITAVRAGAILGTVERALTVGSTVLILSTMVFVTAEIVMRHFFNSPIQGHLELTSLFVPVIVFAAVSYTHSQNAHVGMTLVVDNLPKKVQTKIEFTTLFLTVLTCAVLAYFSYKFTYDEWEIDNVTETPPYWLTWPSAAFIPLGYGLLAIRSMLKMVNLVAPDYYPQDDVIMADELLAPEHETEETPA
ncbi:MAG: TRAP transporter small permease [Alphaproteobacteria bacterium]|nr:TRAP transporter small permease [Alphaproteobacteria bacterium]